MKQKLLAGAFFVATSATSSLALTLKVDLADSIRPVTHVASGSLYGVTETLPTNIEESIVPLGPNVFKNPAQGGNGNQHAFGDAFIVAERLKNTTAKVQLIFADILPGWPYDWKGWSFWENVVTQTVNKKLTCGLDNFDGYELWNEPYGTWKSQNGEFKQTLWKPTYELVRRLDPSGRIIGPCFSYYNSQRVEDFFDFAVKNNCVPDVMCWHQWGAGGIPGAVEHYRNLEKKLGIGPLPITINEYSSDTHTLEGCPGVSVPFIAKFERYGIESAVISWWFTNLPGRLGSLLTKDNEKGGGWYMYKWYGDMSGYMAAVTPPNDRSEGIDGFAAVNTRKKDATIVIGGDNTGVVDVEISGIPLFLGNAVEVLVECVTWQDKDKSVPPPHTVSDEVYNVTGGKITVPVNVENPYYAYHLVLMPGEVIPRSPFDSLHIIEIPGRVEAEHYDLGSEGVAYHDADKQNRGGAFREDGVDVYTTDEPNGYAVGYAQDGEWQLYTVNVTEDGDYDISARLSTGNAKVGIRLYIDDKPISSLISTEVNGGEWESYLIAKTKTTAPLTKGEHTLRIEIEGDWINIDWVEFTSKTASISLVCADKAKDYSVYDASGRFVRSICSPLSLAVQTLKSLGTKSGVYILKTSDGSQSASVVVE